MLVVEPGVLRAKQLHHLFPELVICLIPRPLSRVSVHHTGLSVSFDLSANPTHVSLRDTDDERCLTHRQLAPIHPLDSVQPPPLFLAQFVHPPVLRGEDIFAEH